MRIIIEMWNYQKQHMDHHNKQNYIQSIRKMKEIL